MRPNDGILIPHPLPSRGRAHTESYRQRPHPSHMPAMTALSRLRRRYRPPPVLDNTHTAPRRTPMPTTTGGRITSKHHCTLLPHNRTARTCYARRASQPPRSPPTSRPIPPNTSGFPTRSTSRDHPPRHETNRPLPPQGSVKPLHCWLCARVTSAAPDEGAGQFRTPPERPSACLPPHAHRSR